MRRTAAYVCRTVLYDLFGSIPLTFCEHHGSAKAKRLLVYNAKERSKLDLQQTAMVWYGIVGFNIILYRSFWRRFYGLDDPTNSVIALEDDGQSTRSRANLTRLSSLKGKEKDVIRKLKIEDTETLGRQEAKPSKIKAQHGRPTCKNCSYLCAPL